MKGDVQIQTRLAGRNIIQSIQSHMPKGNLSMPRSETTHANQQMMKEQPRSDISTADWVTLIEIVTALLVSDGKVSGRESSILNNEVAEVRRMHRMSRRLAREDLSHMEHGAHVVMLRQHQNFHKAAQEHQRRAREAVNQAVYESSVRQETRLMMGCTGG